MPYGNHNHPRRLDPRLPFVFDTRTVGLAEVRSVNRTAAAPASLGVELALRDALVLELPLAPLCAEDCPGLCPQCGVRLADAEAGHAHAHAGTEQTTDGTPVPETRKER